MSPTTSLRRRAASGTILTAVLAAPVLVATPVQADGCRKAGDRIICNPTSTKTGSSGGGGTSGGTSGGGPVEPPSPEGLSDNEAVDAVTGPGGNAPPAAAPPSTFELVERALTEKAFPVPVVHTAPKGKTYVRMRTSLWVDGFTVVQTKPVSAGDQTVQATARPVSVTWNLGEKKLVCKDGGSEDGKSCHYTYKRSSAGQPGGNYQITATITWHVTWSCDGTDCQSTGGVLDDQTMTSQPTPLVVSEIQANNGQ